MIKKRVQLIPEMENRKINAMQNGGIGVITYQD